MEFGNSENNKNIANIVAITIVCCKKLHTDSRPPIAVSQIYTNYLYFLNRKVTAETRQTELITQPHLQGHARYWKIN